MYSVENNNKELSCSKNYNADWCLVCDSAPVQVMRMTQAGNTVSLPDSDGDWVVRGVSEARCKEIQVRA